MKKRFTSLLIALSFITGIALAADIDVSDNITSDETWTSDNEYYLDGFIFVEDGATLTIEAGTVVRGYNGTGENASALIIKRGGMIMAEGTAENPIIFTSEDDTNLDLPPSVKGSWGGLILLGNGTHNNLTNDNGIEGVPSEENAYYGGDTEDDNSGVLKYISIRHGGSELAPDEEINGLTLGAVGSGTSIDFIEIMGNDDDGIEWFGGSVSLKYLVVTEVADDSYDIDEGFNGNLQFLYTEQNDDGTGDNFGEHDGGPSSNRWGMPYTTPHISNATYIGAGGDGGNRCLTLREFFGGEYHNSIFADQQKGIRVEYVPEFDAGAMGGAFTQWNNGVLKIENNIFQSVADSTAAGILSVYSPEEGEPPEPIYEVPQDSIDAFVAYFATAGNTINNEMGITKVNPVPDSLDVKGAVFDGLDSWFDDVIFKGAFNPCVMDGHWAGGWTYTYETDTYNASLDGTCYQSQGGTAIDPAKVETYSKVFPNPASTSVTISFDNINNEAFTVRMFSLSGQVVFSAITSDSVIEADVSDLAAGIYTYRIINADN
ncbi:MAG: T9SS type A sorting domain-containing protein, partial [Bacteroidales bacterium]